MTIKPSSAQQLFNNTVTIFLNFHKVFIRQIFNVIRFMAIVF